MRPAGSCSSMPSITGGLNGAPAGRFLDVSGWVGVSGRSRTQLRIRGIVGTVPTINTTLGACEGLDVVVAMVVSPRPERAGQADQDGRPSGAARAAIDLSVVRGVGSSMVVPGSVGSYRPVIAGAKLREGTTTILPRGGERSRESACLQCAFTPLAGARRRQRRTRSMVHRRESHPLLDRPEIDWPCRTRISCHYLVRAAL